MSSLVPPRQGGLSKPVKYGLIGCLSIIALLVGCGVISGIISAITGSDSNRNAAMPATPAPTAERVTTTATPAPAATPSATPQKTYEHILASLDKGYPVGEDDITAKRFRYLLDSLEKKTNNTRQQLADYTVNTQKAAREKYGKEMKLLDLMEQAHKAIPPGQKMDYNEIVVMTMVLMANE